MSSDVEALLRVDNLSKRFGGITAVNKLSFVVHRGERLGIIGPNGSGKSTLINIISGIYKADDGGIFFEGKKITKLKPWEILRLGIARTFQIPTVFKELTLLENVAFPICFGRPTYLSEALNKARELIAEYGLDGEKKASELTLYEERLVEVLRVLSIKPKLLLIDEVLSGLTAQEAMELCDIIVKNTEENCSIVWVEHRIKELTKYVDRLMVLNYGVKIAEGPPQEVVNNKTVVEAYIGA